jgi:hypothetical protein
MPPLTAVALGTVYRVQGVVNTALAATDEDLADRVTAQLEQMTSIEPLAATRTTGYPSALSVAVRVSIGTGPAASLPNAITTAMQRIEQAVAEAGDPAARMIRLDHAEADTAATPPHRDRDRDVETELLAAGWERDDRGGRSSFVFWTLPDVASHVTADRARKILDGEACPAVLFHGPGHQSKAECELVGPHDVHETHYGDGRQAFWRTGDYTDQIDAKGTERNVRSYPKTMGMTGYFNEPPQATR